MPRNRLGGRSRCRRRSEAGGAGVPSAEERSAELVEGRRARRARGCLVDAAREAVRLLLCLEEVAPVDEEGGRTPEPEVVRLLRSCDLEEFDLRGIGEFGEYVPQA